MNKVIDFYDAALKKPAKNEKQLHHIIAVLGFRNKQTDPVLKALNSINRPERWELDLEEWSHPRLGGNDE